MKRVRVKVEGEVKGNKVKYVDLIKLHKSLSRVRPSSYT